MTAERTENFSAGCEGEGESERARQDAGAREMSPVYGGRGGGDEHLLHGPGPPHPILSTAPRRRGEEDCDRVICAQPAVKQNAHNPCFGMVGCVGCLGTLVASLAAR